MRRLLGAWVALAAICAAGPVQAAVTVIGEGYARACFEAARSGASGLAGLQTCGTALADALSAEDRAATFVNRGVIRLQRREADAALADFDAALRLRPDLGESHVNRGAALILLGRLDEAIAAIDRGLALGTADPHEAYFNRGIAHEAKDDLQAAYEDYRRAAELAPDWALPQAELARFTVRRSEP